MKKVRPTSRAEPLPHGKAECDAVQIDLVEVITGKRKPKRDRPMSLGQFKLKVQTWATERGIYEHSTPLAQALKAVSEIGEVADAVIKDDHDALKDGIGDTATCLVNVSFMAGIEITGSAQVEEDGTGALPFAAVASAMVGLCALHAVDPIDQSQLGQALVEAFRSLDVLAQASGLTFEECCDAAWNEIKDRKGRMVAGGAFVKEEELA